MMTYSEYHNQVISVVKDLIEDNKELELDDLRDLLHEEIDQHSYIINYAKSLDVLVHSNNWTVISDVGCDYDDFASHVCKVAYFAMLADCEESLVHEYEGDEDEAA